MPVAVLVKTRKIYKSCVRNIQMLVQDFSDAGLGAKRVLYVA